MTFDCCRHCGDMSCPGGQNDHEVPCPSCQPKDHRAFYASENKGSVKP